MAKHHASIAKEVWSVRHLAIKNVQVVLEANIKMSQTLAYAFECPRGMLLNEIKKTKCLFCATGFVTDNVGSTYCQICDVDRGAMSHDDEN